MHWRLLVIGKPKLAFARAGVEEYAGRLGGFATVQLECLKAGTREAESALLLLDRAGICASAGSACMSGSLTPSHVLRAMGFSSDRARGSLRFSFSRFNTAEEIAKALELLPGIIAKARGADLPPGN